MQLTFLTAENPLLNQPSQRVSITDLKKGKHDDLINSMTRLARGEQTDRKGKILVGLAAPQVGHMLQIILVDIEADGKGQTGQLQVFINPEITRRSEDTSEWYEGCFSTKDAAGNDITGIVSSPNEIDVSFLDRDGKSITNTYRGYTARILRHETDHLRGDRFPDLITDPNKLHLVTATEWSTYRNGEGWRDWPHKAPPERWQRIKKSKT